MAVLFSFSQSTQGRLNTAQATLFINGTKATIGATISTGDTITITTIPGRIFTEDGNSFTFGAAGIKYFTLNSDKTIGTLDLTGETNKVTANAFTTVIDPIQVVKPILFTVTQEVLNKLTTANVKMFKNGTQVSLNTTMEQDDSVTVVPDSGWKLKDLGTYFKISGKPDGVFKITNNGMLGTYSISASYVLNDFFTETIAYIAPIFTITNSHLNQLNNNFVNMYKNDAKVVSGTTFAIGDTMRISPNTQSQILSNTYLNMIDGERIYLDQDATKRNARYTFLTNKTVVSFVANTVFAPDEYTITENDLNKYIAAKAKLFINGSPAVVGSKILIGDVLLATANKGRVFTEDSVYYIDAYSSTYDFIQNEDSTEATITVASNVTSLGVSTVLAPSPDVRGLNNVYKVTQNQLKSITQKRFEVNQQGNVVDYGSYIIGLIELPFNTDVVYDVGSQDVQLGPKKTDIPAILLDRDNIRLNLGVIHVPSVKNNFLDYKNTTALIHLPYCEPINIDMEYVIDQDVTIDYIINLYDGTATINITSSKTDEIVITQNIDMGIVVPFANVGSFPTKNDPRSIKLGFDNGVKTAFIEILRNESILENGFFTIPVVDETTLSTYNGFAQVEQINLKSKATSFEKDLIISQLRDGVIIK